jgi:hypothetical protein
MGIVYIVLDSFVKHDTEEILGIKIDEDLQNARRKQLCDLLEIRFGLEKNSFWNLPSTSKIRLALQLGRKLKNLGNIDVFEIKKIGKQG